MKGELELMKGKMKKVFAALLTATVLIGGMPVNMQANVITETEKTESASEKVNQYGYQMDCNEK